MAIEARVSPRRSAQSLRATVAAGTTWAISGAAWPNSSAPSELHAPGLSDASGSRAARVAWRRGARGPGARRQPLRPRRHPACCGRRTRTRRAAAPRPRRRVGSACSARIRSAPGEQPRDGDLVRRKTCCRRHSPRAPARVVLPRVGHALSAGAARRPVSHATSRCDAGGACARAARAVACHSSSMLRSRPTPFDSTGNPS